jgi:hypothetical protein
MKFLQIWINGLHQLNENPFDIGDL